MECLVCRKNYLQEHRGESRFDSYFICLNCGFRISKEEFDNNYEFVLVPAPELMEMKPYRLQRFHYDKNHSVNYTDIDTLFYN